MICTTINDFYYFEWFEQHWMIWTTSNNLYNVELFVLRLMICITLDDLYYTATYARLFLQEISQL